jgi:hypothetical protein
MGAAIVLGLLALIMLIIFTVAIIAAVSLGIIGLGYSTIQEDEG